MCTGKCSLGIAITLYPLVLLSIICNILLFFPDWNIKYVKEGHITEEVKYMGGFIGGGVMVLIPALYIHLTGEHGCCGNRFGGNGAFSSSSSEQKQKEKFAVLSCIIAAQHMFFSIIFAAVGVAGAAYSFIVALFGFSSGPLCKNDVGNWDTPFKESNLTYVTNYNTWAQCQEPKNVIQFNLGLFISLMVASVLQALLCASQIINGLFGCICGTCNNKEEINM